MLLAIRLDTDESGWWAAGVSVSLNDRAWPPMMWNQLPGRHAATIDRVILDPTILFDVAGVRHVWFRLDEFDIITAVHVDEKGDLDCWPPGNRRVVRADSLSGSGWAALGPLLALHRQILMPLFLAPTSLATMPLVAFTLPTDVPPGRS
ncbi:MAG: hypothetical protein IPI82_03750 [Candidatus Microthrix sp.]|nr:hypothetical protein [Candidatus Microthrix sp.]MBK7321582.1 hypothetical protein [Candidatus Microthrix sp.]